MRDKIRQALQDCINFFGEETFEYPEEFNVRQRDVFSYASTGPIHILINCAISGVDAYSRIKNSTSRNMTTDVYNLTRELCKKYYIQENAAKVVIECIAELRGYTPPTDCEDCEQTQPAISLAPVGNIVQFGDYDWRVLEVEKDKVLILSEAILEQRAYHPCYAGVTWENSKMRQYLNGEFLNNFDPADKDKILETRVTNPDNLWYGITGGNDTFDKVFILNLDEVDRYFGDSGDYLNKRRKKYDNGQWIADDDGWILSNIHDSSRVAKHNGLASFWWLRSPGYSDCTVAYVSTTGNIPPNGDRVCIGRGGVRPALWIIRK